MVALQKINFRKYLFAAKVGIKVRKGLNWIFVIYGGGVQAAIVAANSPTSTRFWGDHEWGCPFAFASVADAQLN